MNRKRAIKKLMGCGFSRNKAANMQKDGLNSCKSNMWVLIYTEMAPLYYDVFPNMTRLRPKRS